LFLKLDVHTSFSSNKKNIYNGHNFLKTTKIQTNMIEYNNQELQNNPQTLNKLTDH